MSALLKQKAKIGVEQKPRKSVEVSSILKRRKESEPIVYPQLSQLGLVKNQGSRGGRRS